MNYSKAPQNCSLKKMDYQMVQIAVAISIIKETPPHLTPGEFARNLQKIICQKINAESEKNDHSVDSETQKSQNIEAGSETITCPESSQTNSLKKNHQDSKSRGKETGKVKKSDLKAAKSIIKESEACFSGTLVHKLLDISSSETQKLLETATDVLNKQGNVDTIGLDKKKSSRKRTKISKVNTGKDVASQCQIQFSFQNQTLEEPLPCKAGSAVKLNPVEKNIASISDNTEGILPPKPDQSVLPDSTSCFSPFNLSVSNSRLDQPNMLVRSTKNNCSPYAAPHCTEDLKVHRDNECERNSLCNNMQSLLSRRQNCASLPSHFYLKWHLESEKNLTFPELQLGPLLNKSDFAESLRVGSPTNTDNWNIRNKHILHEKYGRSNQNYAHDNFSLRNCQELLKAVIEETEDALRDSHLGIYPCWKVSQNFIKKIPEWFHQENFEGEAKYMHTEFMVKMLSLLCQFNPAVDVEQLSVTVNIWWTILRMVRNELVCLCTTPALWHSSGNLLVSVLITVSQNACSQKISGYSTAVVDHMAEVAQTVAEILKKVIGFACSLLKTNPQNPVSLSSAPKLGLEISSVESGLPTVKPNYDWKKSNESCNTSPVNCSHVESSLHKHAFNSADAKQSLKKMANSSQAWNTRIQSALNSLATENSFDLLFETYTPSYKCPSYVNSSGLCTSDSTNLYMSRSPGNTLKFSALSNDPDIKCSLLRWGYLLQTECLPLIKNLLEMLYLQVKEIINLVVISTQDVK